VVERIGRYSREDLENPALEPVRDQLYYLLGRYHYTKADFKDALDLFQAVPDKSDFYARAKFFEGMTFVRQYQAKPATESFKEILRKAIALTRTSGTTVNIVDIAAGHGRYVLDALDGSTTPPDSILLRDYSDINVNQGSALIRAKGLSRIARFVRGDAFNRASLAGIAPRPTIGIVSGLYELFSDNEPIQTSLAGLADAIPAGGFLLYTNQPWHPQLELIARALTSHRQGAPWVMRRRTQAEMDQLVERAGFRKIDERIDEWGIFTVSLAKRIE